MSFYQGQLTGKTIIPVDGLPTFESWRYLNNKPIEYWNQGTGAKKEWDTAGVLLREYRPWPADSNVLISITFYPSGQKAYTSLVSKDFRHKKLDGFDTTWFEDGSIKRLAHYTDQKLNGHYFERFENGETLTGKYGYNQKHGDFITKNAEGIVIRKARYEYGFIQAQPKGFPCECLINNLKTREYLQSMHGGYGTAKLIDSPFYYHEPLVSKRDHLGVGHHADYNTILGAYKPVLMGFPDSNGIKLYLNPCKNADGYSEMFYNYRSMPELNTYRIGISSQKVALVFYPQLLRPWDAKQKSIKEYPVDEVPYPVSFEAGEFVFEKEGLKMRHPENACFAPSLIGNSNTLIDLKDFEIDLSATENQFSVSIFSDVTIPNDSIKLLINQWQVEMEHKPALRSYAGQVTFLPNARFTKKLETACYYATIRANEINFTIYLPAKQRTEIQVNGQKFSRKDFIQELENRGFTVQHQAWILKDQLLVLNLNYKLE